MQTAQSHFLQPYLSGALPWLYVNSYWWTALGFFGNFLFGSRFIFQWLASEKKKQLVVPGYFWWLSFWGSLINLVYAFHIDNAPIIFGVLALPFIYGRNLVLMKRTPVPTAEAAASAATPSSKTAQNYQTVEA
ncbi:MAG: lipid-A-disaccharide synthase N-terminal domain-containing protein [Verrucomicrobiales bacterium]